MNISAAAPTSFENLRPYTNYYTIGNVTPFEHRFEVFYTGNYQFTLTLRGNTPNDIKPVEAPNSGIVPAPLYLGSVPNAEEGAATMVDGEPAAFRNVAPIPENLIPLANAVERFVREHRNAKEIKVRYLGFKREIALQETIQLMTKSNWKCYQGSELKAIHEFGNETLEFERNPQGFVGKLMFNSEAPRFISFSPSEQFRGRMLLREANKDPEFASEWKRFSKVVLDIIDRGVNLPFPEIPSTYKQYISYEVRCTGQRSLIDRREGIPFRFFKDDEASKNVKFTFELNDALQRTITQTKEIAKLNLRLTATLRLKEMRMDLHIKGFKKEHVETIKFEGSIETANGQPVLYDSLKAIESDGEGIVTKKRRDSSRIELVDGDQYESISISLDRRIAPYGF